jgi:3'-5' exoribonuclease
METGKKQFISDLEIGVKVESIFIVANKQIRKKKSGDDYCTVTLQDREGNIEGVLWTEVYCNTEDFTEGDFVLVEGEVKEYKGGKQLVVSSVKRIENKEDINYSDYIKTSRKNIDEMFDEVKKYAARIKNTHLKKLIDLYFEDKKFVKDFKNSTAAVRYHHAFKGGLLEHTLAVTEICDAIYRVYPNLNYDLLISGAILHDIGKIREYRTVVTTEVTDEGKLLGHITIGYGWVLEKIKQIKGFPEELRDRLLHIILSHHGHREFGSPKRPKILEAFIVYHVDHMDADIGGYNIILEENRSGSDWSDYVKNFERSVFLKELKLPGSEYGRGNGKATAKKEERESKEIDKEDGKQDGLF